MWSDVFSMDKFIEVNRLKEVTNPVMLERDNIPTVDGLLSTEIFGRSVDDRREIFAYINLHSHFFNPYIYKVIKRLDRRIEEIVSGVLYVKIDATGEIIKVEDEDDGDTGIEFLYKNWEKIKFKKNESIIRNERVDLLKSIKKDELFCNKFIVCPPFYRDVNLNKIDMGKISYGEINDLYSKLIRMCKSLDTEMSGIPIVGNSTRGRIQNILVEIYDTMMGEIKGKDGLFRQFVLGKSVDYGARSVISAPLFKANRPEEMPVNFYQCGLPLSIACVTFYPFILKWVKDYFYNELFLRKDKYPVVRPDGTHETVRLTGLDKMNDEWISKNINTFVHSFGERFNTIPLENDKGYKDVLMKIGGRYINLQSKEDMAETSQLSSTIFSRPATWTDILYRAAVEVCKDKHVLITRYPIEDYFGIFPNKIHVLSTTETVPVVINGVEYKYYPKVDLEAPTDKVFTSFIDTLTISNLYLKGIGGDYDGDQTSIRGVFTQEANAELDKILKSKKNILNVSGSSIRTTEKEALQTLYSFTKKRH